MSGDGGRRTGGEGVAGFAIRHGRAIGFVVFLLCLLGLWAAQGLPSSVFPQTNFPRVVILVDNGVMPADQMMAEVTRPIEAAMKDIPGAVTVRSATSRGSAEVNVFFTWDVDMVQSELYVLGRLSQIRATLPDTAETRVHRLTFSAFPILGISVTSDTRDLTHLWELAEYELRPRFLQIPGVGRVDIVGGRRPELQVVVDPVKLSGLGLSLTDVTDAIDNSNLVASTGMHEEDHTLYLTVVDGRTADGDALAALPVASRGEHLVRLEEVAAVQRGPEPIYNRVTADGHDAVLLNIRSQPDGSTLAIAEALQADLSELRRSLPPDVHLAFFYDQSTLVRESVGSVWEAIGFGLLLSVVILYAFLRSWHSTLIATLVIPVTVLATVVVMHVAGLTFNLMTLGGIAAAIGLVIDDAIVVVEAIHARYRAGGRSHLAVSDAMAGVLLPLVGSTLTPVVVFLPLAFLDGITGVFFRALALTMVSALLCSLLLAVTFTPALASVVLEPESAPAEEASALDWIAAVYASVLRRALAHRGLVLAACGVVAALGAWGYLHLDQDFLPEMDEGGFVIDYFSPPGTSLSETDRQLRLAEQILVATPEVESYSRRTGARLALAVAEPNTGDFLVKLRSSRERSTEEVIGSLRDAFTAQVPGVEWEFPGILGDLVGDLTWSPDPIEIKLFSPDVARLEALAPQVEAAIAEVPGVVDSFDGLVYTGPTMELRVRDADAVRFGLSTADIAAAVETAMIGRVASSVLEGDRVVDVRVQVDPARIDAAATLLSLPLRGSDGQLAQLSQVADVVHAPGQLELRREDLRQDVAVTARLEGRDLGSAIKEIRRLLDEDASLSDVAVELGGLYEQQQASFRNLFLVLVAAVLLVFTVLLFEFRSFREPLSIVFGAVLALTGTVLALLLTGTALNIVSLLGAIIGVGIVAKNGILMLDRVDGLRRSGMSLPDSLVEAGRRRLRPVLMTSLAAGLGMLPLAWGVGSGADMLRPLAIAVIGALTTSVVLSLVATPTLFSLLARDGRAEGGQG